MSEEQEPTAPRPRLIVPASNEENRPRTRLIAPATVEATEEAVEAFAEPAEEPAEVAAAEIPQVAPLSPPDPNTEDASTEAEEEEDHGEAEQGEFTVINEDTGETHTVPVRVSSMAPPSAEAGDADAATEAEPELQPDPEPQFEEAVPDYGGYATAEEQQAAIAYEEAQQQAYYAQQQEAEALAAQEVAAQAEAYAQTAHAPRLVTPAMGQPAVAYPQQPQQQGHPPQQQAYQQPATAFPPVGVATGQMVHGGHYPPQIGVSRSVPSWALIIIGILVGFIIALILFKFTEFGPLIRPPHTMIKN